MNREICVYDLNIPSGFHYCREYLKEKGAEIRHIYDLKYANTDCVIINPLCTLFEKHWEGIKEYVKENKNKTIFFFAPNLHDAQLKKLIGEQENVKYLSTHDDFYSDDLGQKRLDEIVKFLFRGGKWFV